MSERVRQRNRKGGREGESDIEGQRGKRKRRGEGGE